MGLNDSSVVMVWRDFSVPAGQSLRVLGVPPIDLVEVDGNSLNCHYCVLGAPPHARGST